MITGEQKKKYYKAVLEKNSQYEGLFYFGVTTTGIFCRPTCPARKPNFKNCEFFETVKEAMLSSFRPCQRCQPLTHPFAISKTIRKLLTLVENNPEKYWKDKDLENISIDPSTARRQFKNYFGITFIEYVKKKRMGLAIDRLKKGASIIDTQLFFGYESSSGFRSACTRIMGLAPTKVNCCILKTSRIDTPLGPMTCIADDKVLYLLEFDDRCGLEYRIEQLKKQCEASIIPGETAVTHNIEQEINDYFYQRSFLFKTSLHLTGSPFQQLILKTLLQIKQGETRTYSEVAAMIGRPNSFRAVAKAISNNQLAIIIPCHRVVKTNGSLGGYSGGLNRKQWLLRQEKQNQTYQAG